jgi:hypothetical protein
VCFGFPVSLQGPDDPSLDKLKQNPAFTYDVFISHKQKDTAQFARGLHDVLELRGLRCFLDKADMDAAGNLMSQVKESAALIFIMSNNVFDVPSWCVKEVSEALTNQRRVITVLWEGAAWEGRKFPPDTYLNGSRGDPSIIDIKDKCDAALEYSSSYHDVFVAKLIQRITKP